jgi:hypothetical protein
MTNKTLITILIVSLILFNAYLLVTNISNKSKTTEYENFDQTITDYILEYQGISDYMLQNDGFSLDSIAVVDLENNSIDFNQLLKNHGNNILVCRTSQYNCESCNDYAIQKLEVLCKEKPEIQVVLLGYYDSIRSMRIVRDNHNPPSNMHYYQLLDYSLPIEAAGVPYYFAVDNSLEVEDLFVPNKAYPKLTDHYIEMIMQKRFP